MTAGPRRKPRADRGARFEACGLELGNASPTSSSRPPPPPPAARSTQFRSLRHPPCADAARRAFQRMGRGRGERRLARRRCGQHDSGLAHENLQHLALQAAVAKRHASEMVLVDDGRLLRPACRASIDLDTAMTSPRLPKLFPVRLSFSIWPNLPAQRRRWSKFRALCRGRAALFCVLGKQMLRAA